MTYCVLSRETLTGFVNTEDYPIFDKTMDPTFEPTFEATYSPTLISNLPTSAPAHLPNLPSSQMEALRDLYDYTAGSYWLWRTQREVSIDNHYAVWNFTGYHNPCEEKWQGVLCSCESNTNLTTVFETFFPSVSYIPSPNSTNCSVIALVLVIFNMTGKLPLSIGNLTSIQLLTFSFNNLSGPIPPTFGKMSDLQIFQLDYNRFTGYIPVEMYSLKEMRYFYFLRYATGFHILIFTKAYLFVFLAYLFDTATISKAHFRLK